MSVKQQRTQARRSNRASGFAILEALVALLVVAFGMMAIAAFQFTLSRSSDLAKQRTEATRIAQKEIDRLRAFGQRGADADPSDDVLTFVQDLQVGSTELADVSGAFTNTVYRSERVISAPTTPVPSIGERFRWISVVVSWEDRTGGAQNVTLSTAISDGVPTDLGGLGSGRGLASTLRPRNRNVNIPYPAVNLAGGTSSAFMPPPGNAIFTFNNVTGNVTQSCRATLYPITGISSSGATATALAAGHPFATGMRVTIVGASPAGYSGDFTVTGVNPGVSFTYTVANGLTTPATLLGAEVRRAVVLTEGADLTTLTGVTCTAFATPAYLLSGYVRFKTGNQNADRANIENPDSLTDATRALRPTVLNAAEPSLASYPLSISGDATGNAPSSYECYAQRQLTVRGGNNDPEITIAEGAAVPSGYSATTASRFIAYVCIVVPVDHDDNSATPPIWSGEVTLNPLGWTFDNSGTLGTPDASTGAATGRARLCRFTADYNSNGQLSNGEHPRYYRHVRDVLDGQGRLVTSGSLDNQNYLVVDGGDACPADLPLDFTSNQPNNSNTNTVIHQPASIAQLSFGCSQMDNNDVECDSGRRVTLETTVSNPAPAIPME
jgi:type II secretory pathway pseudopilin PulG